VVHLCKWVAPRYPADLTGQLYLRGGSTLNLLRHRRSGGFMFSGAPSRTVCRLTLNHDRK